MAPRRRPFRLFLILALAAAAAVALSYRYFTNPQRLAARAAAALDALGLPNVHIAHAAFSPADGLSLTNIASAPSAAGAAPVHVRIGLARIELNLAALLFGQFVPTAVDLDDVCVTVLVDPSTPRTSAPTPGPDLGARLAETLRKRSLPPLNLRGGDLQVHVRHGQRSLLLLRHLTSGTGRPADEGYELRLDHVPALPAPLAAVRWRPRDYTLECAADWLDLEVLLQLLGPAALEDARPWVPSGRLRAERVVLRLGRPGAGAASETQLAAAELQVTSGGVDVPMEAPGGTGPRPEPYLRLRDVRGLLHYARPDPAAAGEFGVDLAAEQRGADVRLALRADAGPLNRRLFGPRGAGEPFSLAHVETAELTVRGLEFPSAQTWPAFLGSPYLTGPAGSISRDYAARGRISAQVSVLPPAAGDPAARVEARLEPEGMSCCYRHFPLPFDDVRGTVRISGGRVYLDGLCGRHGSSVVCVRGALENTRHWTGFELNFTGTSVPLDGDLYDALPAHYQRLWEQAAPLGVCDVEARVRRANGSAETGPLSPEVAVDAHLLNGSLNIAPGQRLDHADGWLEVDGGRMWVRDLHGYDGDTGVLLDGMVQGGGASDAANVRVEVHGTPVVEEVPLGPASRPTLRFDGRANACGRIWSQDGQRAQHLLLRLEDGALRGHAPDRAWSVADGCVEIRDALARIHSFHATQGEAQLELAGQLPRGGTAPRPQLDLRVRTPQLDQLYPQFLPPDWTARVADLAPAGAGEVRVQIRPDAHDSAQSAAEIDCTAESLRPRALPLDLRAVSAHLLLAPGAFQLSDASARCGTGQLSVRQNRPGSWDGRALAAAFDVSAVDFEFSPSVVGALPAGLARALERIKLGGEFDLQTEVRLAGAAPYQWELSGVLALRDVALRLGRPVQLGAGELRGTCRVTPQGELSVDAALTVAHGAFGGRPLAGLQARFVVLPGDGWVRLTDLQGEACGGVVRADLAVHPASTDYELTLSVHDVAAAELFPGDAASPPRTGRVDGELWLRGRGDETGTRRGGGTLRIRGSSFVQLPIIEGVARQRAPASDQVDTATVRFLWEGSLLRLERVDIRGRDLRLAGEGSWSLRDDRIQMTLFAAHPADWPRLGVLSEFVESAGRALAQYRVEGTLHEPHVRAEPLGALSEPLQRLLTGE